MRKLERAAKSGDTDAALKLSRARARSDDTAQRISQAFDKYMGEAQRAREKRLKRLTAEKVQQALEDVREWLERAKRVPRDELEWIETDASAILDRAQELKL